MADGTNLTKLAEKLQRMIREEAATEVGEVLELRRRVAELEQVAEATPAGSLHHVGTCVRSFQFEYAGPLLNPGGYRPLPFRVSCENADHVSDLGTSCVGTYDDEKLEETPGYLFGCNAAIRLSHGFYRCRVMSTRPNGSHAGDHVCEWRYQ